MKQNKIPRNEYIIKPKGKTNPYKDDVVYTNLGQWKYPGQVTKIPSNQITMQGVNYPVQGIDDTGYSQMMYPGMDYTFPGESVTEYPMQFPFGGIHTKTDTHMATGGWLDTMQKGGTKKFVQNVSIPYSIQGPYKDVVQTWKDDHNPIDENLLTRQQYKESTFNPKAVSPRNARGLAQIMPDVENDAIKAGIIEKGQSVYDPKVNKKIQKWYMDNLYNASFINKPGVQQDDSVKMAKTLAAYNWGRGNLKKFLGEQKSKGVDIYNSYDWTKNLPKETSDYVNAILLKKNPVFEKDYDKAIEDYEYKRGGQKGLKSFTSKNVYTSINDIMLRNEKVFGHAGKRRYKPGLNYKDGGGWLDNMY